MKINPEDWKPIGVTTLEPAALESVKHNSNLLVIAGPGAGKTELLAQKACFLLQTNLCQYPRRILAISFKKDSASNLKERVEKRLDDKHIRFDSLTFDSFAKSILDNFRNVLPENLRPTKKYEITPLTDEQIQQFLASLDYQQRQDNQPIVEIINCAPRDRRKLIDNFTKRHFTNFQLWTRERTHILDWASDLLWLYLIRGDENGSKITFQMISRLAEYIVFLSPPIKKSIQATYTHLFLDEFQDTTSIQYDFVRTCFYQTATAMTAVGDRKQRIMTWAGARVTVFTDFQNEFLAQENTLTMNFRCAPRLIELQTVVARYLESSSVPQVPNRQTGGVIKSIDFRSESQEASELAQKVHRLIQAGIAPEQICFLFKQQVAQNSIQVIQQLNLLGVNARVEDEYQDLLKDDAVKIALTFTRYIFGLDSDARDEVIRLLVDTDAPLIDLRRSEKRMSHFRNSICRISSFATLEDTVSFFRDIYNFIGNSRLSALIQGFTEDNLTNSLERFGIKFFEIFNRRRDISLSLNEFMGHGVVPCMSIHKSKGLEFEVVFFVGIENGMFWNFSNQQAEDVQTFFVGISRPKSELFLTFCSQRNGRTQSKNSIQLIYDFLTAVNVEYIDRTATP